MHPQPLRVLLQVLQKVKTKISLRWWIFSIWSWNDKIVNDFVGLVVVLLLLWGSFVCFFLYAGLWCELQTIFVRGYLNPGWFDEVFCVSPEHGQVPVPEVQLLKVRFTMACLMGLNSQSDYTANTVTRIGQQRKEPRLEVTHFVLKYWEKLRLPESRNSYIWQHSSCSFFQGCLEEGSAE